MDNTYNSCNGAVFTTLEVLIINLPARVLF